MIRKSTATLSDVVDNIETFGPVATAQFGIHAAGPLELLSHRENAVFRVDDAGSGKRYVLRVHRPGYQTPASIRSELAWMAALRAAGVDTPAALPGIDGEWVQSVAIDAIAAPFDCDVLYWIEGVPPDETDLAETYRLVGSINAKMHRHVQGWTPPGDFERQVWDEDGLLGGDPLWGRFADLEALSDGQRGLLSKARGAVRQRLMAYGKTPDRYGLIHADVLPDNILVTADGPMVIDFDDCGFGWYLYDYATCVSFHEGAESFAAVHDGWVAGYRGVAPLPPSFEAEALTFRLARFIVILGWLHGRRDTPFAAAYTPTGIATACRLAREFLDR